MVTTIAKLREATELTQESPQEEAVDDDEIGKVLDLVGACTGTC